MVLDEHDELDAAGVLAAADRALVDRRSAEVRDLLAVARWADLHAADPRHGPGGRRAWCGQDRLVEVGGEGTPLVQELSIPELAVARRTHTLSTRAVLADVLDLRHRLPRTWAVVLDLACEPWLARRVAATCRHLDPAGAGVVDAAVAEAIAGESPARVLELAQAKTIEADPAGHAARLAAALRRRYVSFSRTDDHGMRHLIARIEAGDAAWIDGLVQRLADILAAHPDLAPDLPETAGADERRATAFGLLAHPDHVLHLLDQASRATDTTEADTTADTAEPPHRRPRRRRSARAVLYLHLHQAALDQLSGVARVETLGPMLLEQVRRMLGHAHVELKPVIDLNTGRRVTAYEIPADVAERTHLRTLGEVFPHATTVSRAMDIDHPKEWDPHGPPGQTGDHNAAPLTRRHHRAKTHLGYRLQQLDHDDYLWTTPHGLVRRVDHAGTHLLCDSEAQMLRHRDALDAALDRLIAEHGTKNQP